MVKKIGKWILALVIIFGLTYAANRLAKINKHVEFPIWAALLGILWTNTIGYVLPLRNYAKTEFFIKIGLVLLGASVNFALIASIGWRGLVQVLIGLPAVFFFTWFIAKWLGLEEKLRAVLSTAVSVCGVSAAIAAAGAIFAKKEHLTYVILLVTLFALPLMVLMPMAANALGLSPSVTGAWIGNNVDTTAAVTGAATIAGEGALKVASVVKMTQNALIGFICFGLALYFSMTTGKKEGIKTNPMTMWYSFPKFVIGFVIVALLVTFGAITKTEIAVINSARQWFFCLAFVCIGLSFSFRELKNVGGKPLLVYALATVFNTALALGLAYLLFKGVTV